MKRCVPEAAAERCVPDASSTVKVKPPYNGQKRLTAIAYDEAVTEETPDGRWFTPRSGWPNVRPAYAGGRPTNLMVTDEHVPEFFISPKLELGACCSHCPLDPPSHPSIVAPIEPLTHHRADTGELRIEILESDGLPSMDAMPLDENDVYALVLFEDVVARTSPIKGAPQQQRHDSNSRRGPGPRDTRCPHRRHAAAALPQSDTTSIPHAARIPYNNSATTTTAPQQQQYATITPPT